MPYYPADCEQLPARANLNAGKGLPSGALTLTQRGPFMDAVIEAPDGTKTHGMAICHEKRLVLAYGPERKMEIGVFERSDQTHAGCWIPPEAVSPEGFGHEPGSLITETPELGTWTVGPAKAIDGTSYSGKLEIRPASPGSGGHVPVRMVWTLEDGVYESFGIRIRNSFYATFNFEPNTPHGLMVLTYEEPGYSGVGVSHVSLEPIPCRVMWRT